MNKIPDSPAPAPPADSPETTLRESAHAAAADAADLAAALPADPRIADRLSEEFGEIAVMIRALPSRPYAASGHDYQILSGLRSAHAAGEDIGETVARSLARLAAELSGSFEVIKARPGSWEAALIAELVRGTVGPDDENLTVFGGPGGSL